MELQEKIEYTNELTGEIYKKFTNSDFLVKPSDPIEKYKTVKEYKSVHWGQRKLGMALIQFLTIYWDSKQIPDPVVVYAGAAHGLNIAAVSELFPTVQFYLYDPGNFKINPTDKIKIFNDYFTNDTAQQWRDYIDQREKLGLSNNIFFLSDIRREIHHSDLDVNEINESVVNDKKAQEIKKAINSDVESEKTIWEDMQMQKDWYKIMKPYKAQLKFRLPYVMKQTEGIFGKTVKYLGGELYRGIWAPHYSTECRLVPNGYDEFDWDIELHESRMFYFNYRVRNNQKYINPYYLSYVDNPQYKQLIFSGIDPPELTNDYDSLAETTIWILYLSRISGQSATLDNVKMLSKFLTITIQERPNNDIWFNRIVSKVTEIVSLYYIDKRRNRPLDIDKYLVLKLTPEVDTIPKERVKPLIKKLSSMIIRYGKSNSNDPIAIESKKIIDSIS